MLFIYMNTQKVALVVAVVEVKKMNVAVAIVIVVIAVINQVNSHAKMVKNALVEMIQKNANAF